MILEKTPILIVIGDKEIENNVISFKYRTNKDEIIYFVSDCFTFICNGKKSAIRKLCINYNNVLYCFYYLKILIYI